jgi:hypothetical protein
MVRHAYNTHAGATSYSHLFLPNFNSNLISSNQEILTYIYQQKYPQKKTQLKKRHTTV